jgi:lupus La protein
LGKSLTPLQKGFGAGDSEDNSLDKIEAYVKQFGPINAIRMRREDTENKDDEDEESKDAKDKKRVFKSGYKKGAFKVGLPKLAASEDRCTDARLGLRLHRVQECRGSDCLPGEEGAAKVCRGGDGLHVKVSGAQIHSCVCRESADTPSREDYVAMKVKEKGLDPKTIRRGNGRKDGDSSNKSRGPNEQTAPFNAFREMAKLRKGDVPRLAKIPDSVAVVGEPLFKPGQRGEKRERDEEPSKPRQTVSRAQHAMGQC